MTVAVAFSISFHCLQSNSFEQWTQDKLTVVTVRESVSMTVLWTVTRWSIVTVSHHWTLDKLTVVTVRVSVSVTVLWTVTRWSIVTVSSLDTGQVNCCGSA